ncbi:STAS domain-containing protein [Actinoplanes sp. CA-142083]|uniref:STAS domain-containing protein n=1 Tax=Actinoplanes sp. CA-142083 TaxID=3239903 RepID=UPI003D919B4D
MIDEIWDYDVTHEGRTCTVSVSGEIDMSVSLDVFAVFASALDRPDIDHVRADLAAVSFLGSAGLAILVNAKLLACDRGRQFTVTGVKGLPLQAMEITGLLPVLTDMQGSLARFVTEDDALRLDDRGVI